MKKWLLLLFVLSITASVFLSEIKEKASWDVFRNQGIPVTLFQKSGIQKKDMERYAAFWKDLQYFPLAGKKESTEFFYFEDTWHARREYGGERLHEGCDVFGEEARSGYYPVVSMTDGQIEQIGWLPLGGWRIGIRSPGGGYFYYAHLSGYASDFQRGDRIKAGEVLGFLGDSGYGEEGTRGKFVPHLHLGIYVRTSEEEEYPLNPYPVLQFLQEKQKNFFY